MSGWGDVFRVRAPAGQAKVFRLTVQGTKYLRRLSTEQCLAFSKILTPHPLSTQQVCPPPRTKGRRQGGTYSPGGEGSIFWKTPQTLEWPLTVWSLYAYRILSAALFCDGHIQRWTSCRCLILYSRTYTVSWRIRIFNCIEEVPRFFFPIEFNSAFQISNSLQFNCKPYTV